jgi:hypothetical protein
MKYIEDYVTLFTSYVIRLSDFDQKIALSLGEQCLNNKPFTSKQADISIRLLRKYKGQFISLGHTSIIEMLDSPIFKHSFRIVDTQKLVYVDHVAKKFNLKFPFDQDLVTKIRGLNTKKGMFKSEWNADAKQWTMDLNEECLKFIIDYLLEKNFEVSEEIQQFIEKYQEITEDFEKYIPMLVKENDTYFFKNMKTEFSTTELTAALVQSAKLAVHVFDDVISEEIEILAQKNPLARVFTKQESQNFQLSKNDYTRTSLIKFAKDMDCLTAIFLDESATSDTMQMWVDALKSADIDLDEVGVFCRRKNDTDGIKFNTVVKEYGLNKSPTDNVKWVFLMTKYPKSLIKADKIADVCLFDNKYINAHHTVKSIVKNSVFNFLHNEHMTRGDEFVVL